MADTDADTVEAREVERCDYCGRYLIGVRAALRTCAYCDDLPLLDAESNGSL